MKWLRREPIDPGAATLWAWARVAILLAIAIPMAVLLFHFVVNDIGSSAAGASGLRSGTGIVLPPAPRPDPELNRAMRLRFVGQVASPAIAGYEFVRADREGVPPRLAVLESGQLTLLAADGAVTVHRVTVDNEAASEPFPPPASIRATMGRMPVLHTPDGGVCLLVPLDGALHAIDMRDGRIAWRAESVEDATKVWVVPLASGEDGVFVASMGGRGLRLLDARGVPVAATDPFVPLPSEAVFLWSPISWPQTPESILLITSAIRRFLLRVEGDALSWHAVEDGDSFADALPVHAGSALIAAPGTHERRRVNSLAYRPSRSQPRYSLHAEGTAVVPSTMRRQYLLSVGDRALQSDVELRAMRHLGIEVLEEGGGRLAHLSAAITLLLPTGGFSATPSLDSPRLFLHVGSWTLEYNGIARPMELADNLDERSAIEPGDQISDFRLFVLPDGLLLAVRVVGSPTRVMLFRLEIEGKAP